MSLKRFDEAERILKESCTIYLSRCGETCPEKMETRQRLARLYEAWGKPAQAARFR